jgi:protein TilB
MVQRIDEALLRRRSEHNEGVLSTLQEVSLHQFDIEKIENLDKYCRNLQILYLQSNQISKIGTIYLIENLHKLKSLKYLQLALNNIRTIENLEHCESLEKLDLTVNFIEDLTCLENLKDNSLLRQLYLVGNPCTEDEDYRSFVIEMLPQLQILDGKPIEMSEKIIARQQFARIQRKYREKNSRIIIKVENNHSQILKVQKTPEEYFVTYKVGENTK